MQQYHCCSHRPHGKKLSSMQQQCCCPNRPHGKKQSSMQQQCCCPNRPHGPPCRPDGFFHSEAVFPKLREFGFFPRGYSHSARMYFHGWEKALEARLQRRYANHENDQKNTPGLVFLFFLIVRMAIILNWLRRTCSRSAMPKQACHGSRSIAGFLIIRTNHRNSS